MKLAAENDIRQIDRLATEKYMMPTLLLMEGAGSALTMYVKKHLVGEKRVIIVAGMGNNGGDGLVCARMLHNCGYNVSVFLIGNIAKMSKDTGINYDMLKALNVPVTFINDVNDVKAFAMTVEKGDIVVDCIFGIGLRRNLEGIYYAAVEAINTSAGFIVACDIPSGISADDGKVMGCAVKADETITLCCPKIGNIMYPGAAYNGILHVADIGIPLPLLEDIALPHSVITADDVKSIIPKRRMNTHKGTYGKAALIAGTYGMTGAAILSSQATIRSGVGLLRLIIPESLYAVVTANVPEAVTVPIAETRRGVFAINQIEKLLSNCRNAHVVAIGPGCGQSTEIGEILRQIFIEINAPLVIDADGLNTLAKNMEIINNHVNEIVLTPHPGEMSRLTGLSVEMINNDPIAVAKEYAQKWQVTVVLKGSKTVVASKDGEIFININGNPGMATAGSGDVLTGIITALIAQGIPANKAAIAGVYLHGSAGDCMARQKGEYSLKAGDLVEGLAEAFMMLVDDSSE